MAELHTESENFLLRQWPDSQLTDECDPRDVLHHQKVNVLLHLKVVDGGDVRMVKLREMAAAATSAALRSLSAAPGMSRIGDAASAVALNTSDPQPRYLLMQIYSQQADYLRLASLVEQTTKLYPDDPGTLAYIKIVQDFQQQLAGAESLTQTSPTPDSWLQLSLMYHRAGRYRDCINAATEALKLKPDYAETYNNLAAAYQSLGQWDDAIRASQQALKLNPKLQLARNNLTYSKWQKEHAPADH